MMADEQKEMQSMAKGNIAVAVGMKNVGTTSAISSTVIYLPSPPPNTHILQTYTGDTIVLSSTAAASASADSTSLSLEVLDLPPPVFFCSVEPSSAAYQKGPYLSICYTISNCILAFIIIIQLSTFALQLDFNITLCTCTTC